MDRNDSYKRLAFVGYCLSNEVPSVICENGMLCVMMQRLEGKCITYINKM